MTWALVNMRQNDLGGFEPDLPAGTSFACVQPPRGQGRALVRVDGPLSNGPGITVLPDDAAGGVEQAYEARTGQARTREQINAAVFAGANRGT